MHVQSDRTRRAAAVALLGVLLASGLSACRGDRSDKPPRELLIDMDHQQRWNPQAKSEFFPDARTMRKPVANTVAFGRSEVDPAAYQGQAWAEHVRVQRAALLQDAPEEWFGTVAGIDPDTAWLGLDREGAADRFVRDIPIPVTKELLRRGQERFNIYCATCHGYQGEGGGNLMGKEYGGLVGRKWSYVVPSFHGPVNAETGVNDDPMKYRDKARYTGRDGYLYYVAMNGVRSAPTTPGADPTQLMPGYAHAMAPHDGWAIVAYIRALQLSRDASIDDVPADQRDMLNTNRRATGGDQ